MPPDSHASPQASHQLYQQVAQDTCAAIFSCCKLADLIANDLIDRLSGFSDEVENEFQVQRRRLEEIYRDGNRVGELVEILEYKSPRYRVAVSRVYDGGNTSATRALGEIHRLVDFTRLGSRLDQAHNRFFDMPSSSSATCSGSGLLGSAGLGSAGLGSTGHGYNRKRTSSAAFNSITPDAKSKRASERRLRSQLQRLTEIKMTPKLASAASIFQAEMRASAAALNRRSIKALPDLGDDEAPSVDDDMGSEPPMLSIESAGNIGPECMGGGALVTLSHTNDELMSAPPAPSFGIENRLPPSQRPSTTDSAFSHYLKQSAASAQLSLSRPKYNCEPIVEEVENSKLLNMFKSPLLRIQEHFGLGSFRKGQACGAVTPVPPKGKSYHRSLISIPTKKVLLACEDEFELYDDIGAYPPPAPPPWGTRVSFLSTVREQINWNPYTLFGTGVRVVRFEDVFQTPDFRFIAHNAACESFTSGRRQLPTARLERWYNDKAVMGFHSDEGMTLGQLSKMVALLEKTTDLSTLAYEPSWVPCDHTCTHNTNYKQPWFKIAS